MLLIFGAGIWLILAFGSPQHPQPTRPPSRVEHVSPTDSPTPAAKPDSSALNESSTPGGTVQTYVERVRTNLRSSLSILLLQLVVIIISARFFGGLFRRVGQPRVMGEIIAGIVLGPSVLGLIWPQAMSFLFPTNFRAAGCWPSGRVFIRGWMIDPRTRKMPTRDQVVTRASSSPFSCDVAFAAGHYLFREQISFPLFSLFLASRWIAFPFLLREFLKQRAFHKRHAALLRSRCAAVDDVSAWCALAWDRDCPVNRRGRIVTDSRAYPCVCLRDGAANQADSCTTLFSKSEYDATTSRSGRRRSGLCTRLRPFD